MPSSSSSSSSERESIESSITSSSTGGITKDRLRVIIAGGSNAGLTLAHSLYHNDIDFVLLEARNEIAPQVGASIVILPNGARILDQLGIFDNIYAMVEPLHRGLSWTGNGKLIVSSNVPYLTGARSVQTSCELCNGC
jgi:2-polyprenyl-6-methoxyphenol hydroxylase-like FAD-dependent oxidoreductase